MHQDCGKSLISYESIIYVRKSDSILYYFNIQHVIIKCNKAQQRQNYYSQEFKQQPATNLLHCVSSRSFKDNDTGVITTATDVSHVQGVPENLPLLMILLLSKGERRKGTLIPSLLNQHILLKLCFEGLSVCSW